MVRCQLYSNALEVQNVLRQSDVCGISFGVLKLADVTKYIIHRRSNNDERRKKKRIIIIMIITSTTITSNNNNIKQEILYVCFSPCCVPGEILEHNAPYVNY